MRALILVAGAALALTACRELRDGPVAVDNNMVVDENDVVVADPPTPAHTQKP